MNHKRGRHMNATHQKGVATILVMLLLGIGMLAASLGLINSQRSAQEQQVAVHAQTHAQAAAWAAAETLQAYLGTLEATELEALPLHEQWSINQLSTNELTAWITERALPDATDDDYRITAQIQSFDQAARSSSTLEVVYRITPEAGNEGITLDANMDFGDSLTITGGINFSPPPGQSFDVRVGGDINVNNVSVSGIGRLAATGDITLGSAVEADELFANGDVTLTGGSQSAVIYAVGQFTMSGGTVVNSVYANEAVTVSGGTIENSADTLGDIVVNAWADHGILTAGGRIEFKAGTAEAARAVGDVDVTAGNGIDEILSQADVACSQGWLNFPKVHAGGAIHCNSVGDRQANMSPPPHINLMEELQPFSMDPPPLDVWAVKGDANYIFEVDEVSRMKVTVQHVNGIDDGVYYLGTFTGNREYLCTDVDAQNNCMAPTAVEARTICNGFSAQNACFDYTNGVWSIDGKNLAPGAMWFKGDLDVGTGKYYNSFMATGNISTSGGMETYAINYMGAAAICDNNFPSNPTSEFAGLYPTNFCEVSGGGSHLKPNALGNIALMAGGINPDVEPKQFTGGEVKLGASNVIGGSVLAGDVIETGGSSTVYGYVSAVGWGNAGQNLIGASTTIDLSDLPETYNPLEIPDMTGEGGSGEPGEVTVQWSRYL